MKFIEVKTTEENFEQVVLKRAILICWVLLFICFIIKLLGGHVCDLVCNNEKFIKICSYVDENLFLKIIIGWVFSFATYTLFYCSVCKIKFLNNVDFAITLTSTLAFVVLRLLIKSVLLKFLINVLQLFIVPIFISKSYLCGEWFFRRLIISNCLNVIFQIVSALTKDVGINISLNNTLIGVIFGIDVVIMLALYYLYSNKNKGDDKMSWILDWLFGKSDAQLEKMKATRLKKIEKLQGEINEIDKELSRKRAEK